MKKILVDLNVLLDFLVKRENHQSAATIVALCESKKIKGYLASHEITTLAYFLRERYKNKTGYRSIINDILDIFSSVSINESMLRNALVSKIDDYEDAVIEQAAIKEKVDYIVTNNISDFKKSIVKYITPKECLVFLKT